MEKHRCKLCFKSFSNGRALGGHMSFHMATLSTSKKTQEPHELGDEMGSASSSGEEEEEKDLYYVLRENPKKSFRMVDPEFSAGSAVQDRESETESSRIPSRRRTKRNRKSRITEHQEPELKKLKLIKPRKAESSIELEPVSSVSDTTPEEDVALYLMMLSRDIWIRDDDEEEEEEAEKSMEKDELKFCQTRTRAKYQCGTCKKVFRSYQALGGHRASHKKIRGCNSSLSSFTRTHEAESKPGNVGTVVADRRIHECPVCFRVFKSGQALGGHKRSHLSGSNSTKNGVNLIDLNLPAPVDDEDMSQVELSAVSDSEFVDSIK
ncbi:hypothetical protein HHK36_028663 [Tetracentron sinense]|uniref:C2H2-type domain-containing protein n=1 Tax=Tetracentron sinense TaxID=13715 RepID=A0A834YFT1_TETSI|nr:hypothetical protein HHK36_028663 [Tetracentron sinense]